MTLLRRLARRDVRPDGPGRAGHRRSRGLGWAMAQVLAGAGATVVLNGREPRPCRRDATLCGRGAFQPTSRPLTCGPATRWYRAVDRISARHGRARHPVEQRRLDRAQAAAGTERRGLARRHRCRPDRRLAPRPRGRAAHVAGRLWPYDLHLLDDGSVARPGVTGYVAAKTGLHGLVRALAVELAPNGITVNALGARLFSDRGQRRPARRAIPTSSRGFPHARPMGRWGDPKELGAAALYLASRRAGFTTGSVLTVDGGLTAAI